MLKRLAAQGRYLKLAAAEPGGPGGRPPAPGLMIWAQGADLSPEIAGRVTESIHVGGRLRSGSLPCPDPAAIPLVGCHFRVLAPGPKDRGFFHSARGRVPKIFAENFWQPGQGLGW